MEWAKAQKTVAPIGLSLVPGQLTDPAPLGDQLVDTNTMYTIIRA